MTRGRWLAVAGAAAAGLLGAVLVLRSAEPADPADPNAVALAIAAELRCPDCAGLSVADSPTRAAAEIRRQVDEQLAAGRSPDQIKASFVARYGAWILLTPPGPAPWLVPIGATAVGAAVVGWWLLGSSRVPASALSALAPADRRPSAALAPQSARRLATFAAAALALAVAVGYLLPGPLSLGARTVVNQPLAEAQAAEAARQAEIERLLAVVAADPEDIEALSDMADAYLAGAGAEDLQAAAYILLALISLEPGETDHYARLISAYVRAADWTDAAAATVALADLDPASPDVPFFEGLIAWRGHRDAEAALEAFDRFLAIAPDDPRATMVRALRQEAAATVD